MAPLLASDLITGCNTRFGGTGLLHLVRVKMSSFSAKAGDQNQTFQSRLLLLNVAAWMRRGIYAWDYWAIPAFLLGLLFSFHLELSFSNSDGERLLFSLFYLDSGFKVFPSKSTYAFCSGDLWLWGNVMSETPSLMASEARTQQVSTQRFGSHLYFINIIIIFILAAYNLWHWICMYFHMLKPLSFTLKNVI